MKTFTRDYRITGDYPAKYQEYLGDKKFCILDIEATGLDPSKHKVCLVALLTRIDTGVRITQFLAENHYEEYKVLKEVVDFLERQNIDYLITFNGQAFDIPFFNKRLDANFMEGHLDMYNFDLYRFIMKGTNLKKKLKSLSQMSLEAHYGLFGDRKDTITGRESIALFDQYAVDGNSTIEKTILTHNREDVLQLHRLMFQCLTEPMDFDDVMAQLGFPSADGRFTIRPSVSLPKSHLRICGNQLKDAVAAAFFPDIDNQVTAVFNSTTSSYEIDVPIQKFESNVFVDMVPLGIDMSEDPEYVNGFLVLNSQNMNRLAEKVLDKIVKEKL